MIENIAPVDPEMKLAQLLGNDYLAQVQPAANPFSPSPAAGAQFTGNPFEDILSKAIESLEGISRSEVYTNQMVDRYLAGEIELHEVMVAQSKLSVMVQLAVTTINSAVTSFKEITQMQV